MERRGAEETLRAILHDAYPATIARLALEAEKLPGSAHVVLPVSEEVGLGVEVEFLRLAVREELDRRFAKSVAGVGGGT